MEKLLENKLLVLLDYILTNLNKEDYKSCVSKENYSNSFIFKVLQKTIEIFEYNKKPQIVPDKIYSSLQAINFTFLGAKLTDKELYRGTKKIEYHSQLLNEKTYHLGFGSVSSGIYVTQNYDIAKNYTYSKNDDLILKLKIPDMKVIDTLSLLCEIQNCLSSNKTSSNPNHQEIFDILKIFINSIKDDHQKEEILQIFYDDFSIIAIILGYDAVYDYEYPSFALFNRSKLCISESEYDRIMSLSKNQNQPN